MKDFHRGTILALLSAISGAYLFIFSKHVLAYVGPATYCSYYYLFAAVYFTAWLALSRQRTLFRIPPRAAGKLLLIAGLESVSVFALFTAVKLMDPTLASFFNNSQTVFIILLSAVFLKERFNRLESLGTAVALAGILLISYRSAEPALLGMALTLLSAGCFSCTVVLVKKNLGDLPPLTIALYRAVALMAVFNIYALAGPGLEPVSPSLLAYTAAGALFGPFLNILFYFYSLKYFEASKTSLVRASQPIFVLINAALFLHIVPAPREIAGGLVIILGLYILVLGHERSLAAPPPDPAR
ncbi:MAG TPA: DMT family transporter [Acidobacteriota bacterium]|nr:DMT family transporter [Acidobacteriota bacterium]HNR40363.1 DMT family transporter [Acidobacteriota bacterium]HNT99753.1 DMT family transporter [Acidobacteriota bacterium]HPB29368.1 DMT family transporter [Acidobacteriota bacterium]